MDRNHAKDVETYASLVQIKRKQVAEALQELAEYSEKLRKAASALSYSMEG